MILVGNGTVITMDKKNPLVADGAVLIDGEKIHSIGNTQALRASYPTARFVDAKGKIIMPGFINAHEHFYSEFARGSAIPEVPPKNFLEILEGTWWYLDSKLSLEHVYYSALVSCIESIRNGVTFINDHHASFGAVRGSLSQIATAVQQTGMRCCLSYEISERNGKEQCLASVDENFEFLDEVSSRKSSMLNGMIGLHASFTLSDETLERCQSRNGNRFGYHVHIAEGKEDELMCRQKYGCSVVSRFERAGILGSKTVAGHCIHVSEEDMDILKSTGTAVVHNPESNMGNCVGAPDVFTMIDKGIIVGLGTDGYTHDMTESVKVAQILQKHRSGNPSRGFSEAVSMLTEHNACIASRICGVQTGVLSAGAAADVIVVDYNPPTPLTAENFAGHLMFGISGRMTDTTIINGTVVMEHKTLCNVDEEKILAESRESAKRLWRTL